MISYLASTVAAVSPLITASLNFFLAFSFSSISATSISSLTLLDNVIYAHYKLIIVVWIIFIWNYFVAKNFRAKIFVVSQNPLKYFNNKLK